MADKIQKMTSPAGVKPVPMKLFATWEVDRTAPNCIPRLCTLNLTRLQVLKQLDTDITSIIVSVKMQSSKRVLRSNEITLPPGGIIDTELDLSFSLQYPHFLKREGNVLQIMLQRRKRYKNRTILGFKTLAIGIVNMAQVLQRHMDRELDLFSAGNSKEKDELVAKVMMLSLSSQPVEQEDTLPLRKKQVSETDGYSDLEEGWTRRRRGPHITIGNTQPTVLSPLCHAPKPSLRPFFSARSSSHDILTIPEMRQRYSQHVSDDSSRKGDSDNQEMLTDDHEGSDSQLVGSPADSRIAERGDVSGSGSGESSVKKSDSLKKSRMSPPPKPKFFARDNKSSLKESKEKRLSKEFTCKLPLERKNSGGVGDQTPRKALLEQLGVLLGSEDIMLDSAVLVDTSEKHGQLFAHKVHELTNHRVVSTMTSGDVKAILSHLVNKIQKFCNTNSRTPSPIKIVIAGSDRYVNTVLQPFVEQFSAKPPDWQGYVRFLVIPIGPNVCLAKYLGSIDSTYHSLFLDGLWRDAFEKSENHKPDSLYQELANRVSRYLTGASAVLQLPIAEAMVTCKEKGSEEDSSQSFTPFITDVKISSLECGGGGAAAGYTSTSVDLTLEDSPTAPLVSGSPPLSSHLLDKPQKEATTPPGSPNVSLSSSLNSRDSQGMQSNAELDLQVEYWLSPTVACKDPPSGREKKDASGKLSMKSTFRSLTVLKLPSCGELATGAVSALTMMFITKEKKQKIMRIGKKSKEKDTETRQTVEGIQRLICMGKSSNYPLKVAIDGVEWSNVKFFQLSAQWQTHTKHFPIAVFSQAETTC
ncbi:PREDICTED: phosphofurin acidic cluster sorting protein 2-like [Priapulus caudatus]|uniref:Phosphofurin acidic cluster sorting protein 2-like n=1 Tax=Priapulus caudatus TaxID=37621 RepID=A0ABM1DSH5_PRICU|nr:PREDICTED: phosphofurin acidic cluster sorting protein 2-like [Priapulus caudatus]